MTSTKVLHYNLPLVPMRVDLADLEALPSGTFRV